MTAVKMLKVLPDEAGMRLDRWFSEHFSGLSFGHLQKLLRTGQVRVDGGRAKTNTRLESAQIIRVPPLGSADHSARGERTINPKDADALTAMTLFEDDMVLILNKPSGLAVQGGSGTVRHVDGMLEALRDAKGRKPRLVHRLDKDTSGVLVVAKTKAAASALAASFRARSTRKIYWALVRGVPKPMQGRISTYLVKENGVDGDRMRVTSQRGEGADHALTLYNVVETSAKRLAWVSLKPVTGRTHQLRAHCNHIAHPIIGDAKYFDVENWTLPGGIQNKLHLLARRIVMPHPNGGEIDVTAPLPPHMRQSWNLLGLNEKDDEDASREDI